MSAPPTCRPSTSTPSAGRRSTSPRPTRERASDPAGPFRLASRLAGRVVVILLASALVTWATILVASSALGPTLTNAMAPAVARPGGAPKPTVAAGTEPAATSEQAPGTGQANPGAAPAQSGGAPAPGAGQPDATAARSARPAGGAPGGRNVPSLQRGYPDLLKYGAILAGTTLLVVLLLRVRRPRPRGRPTPASGSSRSLAPGRPAS